MIHKSLEAKLYEAYVNEASVTLSYHDVRRLLCDDAVGCRITNSAVIEAAVDEPGVDMVGSSPRTRLPKTWELFKQKVVKAQQT